MKEPKWKAEWDRLVGDAKGLEIKNWRKYQPEMEDGFPASWFKSYVTTDEDEMADVGTMRWLKDALRRARARRGGPLVCNMDALCTSTACNAHDRQNFPRLVVVLLSCGFLIPTNQQFSPLDKSRKEKRREEPVVAASAEAGQGGASPVRDPDLIETPGQVDPDLVRYWADNFSKVWKGKVTDANIKQVAVSCFKYMDACGAKKAEAIQQAWHASRQPQPEPGDEVEMPKSKAFVIED